MLIRTISLRAMAGVVLAALMLAAPADGADCDVLGGADAVICEVNRQRADRGFVELAKDRRLQRAATAHARDMVRRGYFSHTAPEGAKLADRLRGTGYITGRLAWRVHRGLAHVRVR